MYPRLVFEFGGGSVADMGHMLIPSLRNLGSQTKSPDSRKGFGTTYSGKKFIKSINGG